MKINKKISKKIYDNLMYNMSHKIVSKNKYPDLAPNDTHFLVLTKNASLGINFYGMTDWKPIIWTASSLYTKKNGEPDNEYTHYITVRIIDIDFLHFSEDDTNLLFTTVQAEPHDSSDITKGYKDPILEFHDYIYDPAIGNFNELNNLGYNHMIGKINIFDDYYWGNTWNGGTIPYYIENSLLKDSLNFKPLDGDRTHGPLTLPLMEIPIEFLIATMAQHSSVIKVIDSDFGLTTKKLLRARKWNDISNGNGSFMNNFFKNYYDNITSTFDISNTILTNDRNAWKKTYMDLNDWFNPLTDTHFNLSNFIKKSYRKDLNILNDMGFSTTTLLYLNKEIRVLQNLGKVDSSLTLHSINKTDFLDFYEDGYRFFQFSIYIIDESYNTPIGSKVNPIEIILTFELN